MVDHNEFSQSVRAIEKAELVEVIDHHRISDFSTRRPVAFRNEIVGSTATIITRIFQERQIEIPNTMAGLLLGVILSDTLKFLSPTTTQKDIFIANVLGDALVFVGGILGLHFLGGLDFSKSVAVGLTPFILPDLLKMIAITIISIPIFKSLKFHSYFSEK